MFRIKENFRSSKVSFSAVSVALANRRNQISTTIEHIATSVAQLYVYGDVMKVNLSMNDNNK